MGRAGRRIIAAVTAAFVLLCGVLCPCGVAEASASAPHPTACHGSSAEPAPAPACHSAADAERRDHHQEPGHHGGGHDSCRHCHPQAAGMEPAKKPDETSPLASAVAPLSATSPAPHSITPPLHATARSLTPPQPPPSTLLGLHCALNT